MQSRENLKQIQGEVKINNKIKLYNNNIVALYLLTIR